MEIEINKDVRDFKPKEIGMFSFKEAGFVVVSLGLGYGGFILSKTLGIEGLDKSAPFILIPMIPVLAFGFLKPQGLSLMVWIKTVLLEKLIGKKNYPMECEDDDETTIESIYALMGEDFDISTLDFPEWSDMDVKKYEKSLKKAKKKLYS